MPDIKLPDGSIHSYEQAVTIAEVAASIGAGLARAALAGKVDGVLVDTSYLIERNVDLAIITEMGNARNNVNVMSSNVVVVCGLLGAGTVSEVALALKAGKPVILVGATPTEEKFFKKLGGRLIASVESPEDAITLMMKQFEQQQPNLVQGARSWGV